MTRSPHTPETRARVLAAYKAGEDWMLVAAHNGMPPTTARRLVANGRVESLSRGGARAQSLKCTPEIEAALEEYIDENCTYTLAQLQEMVWLDFRVNLSTSTISDKLAGKLYTLKQVRVEPRTCNNAVNKATRKTFAEELRKHMRAGDFIVYYDETNFNVYCKRTQGRAEKGKRATVVLPPSKGANLQIQCAVATEVGLVHHQFERGSIQMAENAAFVDEVYEKVNACFNYSEHFIGKKVVIVLDNAPAHSRTEERVTEHDNLVLLRLAPYSPMCNPIDGCFSVLKAKIKAELALSREELVAAHPRGQLTAARMEILERAARRAIN